MTRNQRLRAEVAHTETVLREAAARLLNWADVLALSFFEPALPPDAVRQLARVLAHQCGRLSMAREQAVR